MQKTKYTFKEKLEITESIVTIIMFVMAVWGTIISVEKGFWGKLNHIVTHYHQQINDLEKGKFTDKVHALLEKADKKSR
ncbi:MAG: hypothetical protein J6N49_00445 [Alphaproteobacteria bacterium]|nr:hypothetical protein [Alphaproteobacteria bacterium]